MTFNNDAFGDHSSTETYSEYGGNSIDTGVYLEKFKIIEARELCGEHSKSGEPRKACLHLKVIQEGTEWEKQAWVSATLDKNNKHFPIEVNPYRWFVACGIFNAKTAVKNGVPVIANPGECIGRTVYGITYISGTYTSRNTGEEKNSYTFFEYFLPADKEENAEILTAKWKERREKLLKTKFKPYTPELIQTEESAEDTSFEPAKYEREKETLENIPNL